MPAARPPRIAALSGDVLAVLVVSLFAVSPFPDDGFRADGWLIVVALLPAAAMLFRRRFPLFALGVSLACAVFLAFAGVVSPSALIAVAISAFATGERRGRLVGITAVGATSGRGGAGAHRSRPA
ncbi:hypothetical protein [Microbacterium oxydans]|uniref:hypothetical protein n=1 Tax=Microbacterium oxydans TaxID=82380 RepID=UPI0024ACCC20|nr:hypothetical protein [Microbacterium oxydans]